MKDEVEQVYRITAVVAVAMVVSACFYAGIVEFLTRTAPSAEPAAPQETIDLLRQVFRGLALLQFLALTWLRNRPHPGVGEPRARLAKLRTFTIARLVLAESIAVYGLVLFVLSRDPSDFYYLFLFSLLCFVIAFPRRGRWEEVVGESHELLSRGV
jgi:hypothetical protein